jgi:sec-independent protein translocase protein TatA
MMGSLSIWHWLIVGLVAVVVFGGRGRLSSIMGDAAKGIRAFQDGLKGDGDTDKPTTSTSPPPAAEVAHDASKDTAKH